MSNGKYFVEGIIMASKRRIRRNQCSKKKVFTTFEEARIVAYKMTRKHKYGGISPYRCHFCNKFHVGHYSRMSHSAPDFGVING